MGAEIIFLAGVILWGLRSLFYWVCTVLPGFSWAGNKYHVKFSEQIRPWDTLACCWDVKQPTNKKANVLGQKAGERKQLMFYCQRLGTIYCQRLGTIYCQRLGTIYCQRLGTIYCQRLGTIYCQRLGTSYCQRLGTICVQPNNGTVSRATLVRQPRDGWSTYGPFQALRYSGNWNCIPAVRNRT